MDKRHYNGHDKGHLSFTDEFIGLTDEEIIYEADQFDWDFDCVIPFAKAIEQRLRIKNGL